MLKIVRDLFRYNREFAAGAIITAAIGLATRLGRGGVAGERTTVAS